MQTVLSPSRGHATPAEAASKGMIIRQKQPENLEFRFETLKNFLTPTAEFYVRCHFAQPEIDAPSWRLRVEGEVGCSLELSLEDLRQIPSRTLTSVLECSGNGRVFLVPKTVGVPWELGAVSNAEWTGIPLKSVLERAQIKPEAVEVIFQGADSGEPSDEPKKPGRVPFARSLPLAKALEPDVLLAFEMNHEPLTKAHGWPLRLLVPDWYAMASVKWLTRIIVSRQPFHGYFQTFEYAVFQPLHEIPSLMPARELEPKAQIARPIVREFIPASTEYRVHGAAWSSCPIAKVEVSVNGGRDWKEARLLGDPVPHGWRLWEVLWRTPSRPGACTLMARATDSQGRTQPLERPAGRLNAVISHVLPIEVQIK